MLHCRPGSSGSTERFYFVDALRGIAALAVLFFHISIYGVFKPVPGWLMPLHWAALHAGFLGVEVFFVISGFVIAYSLRNARITGRFAVNFALRRSLRLDPPCWAAIALAVAISALFTRVLHATQYPVPAPGTVAANLFYVQGFLHKSNILVVLWTLCDEVQFYLFFLLLQAIVQRFARTAVSANRGLTAMLLITGGASLLAYAGNQGNAGYAGWAINWWFLFAFGALICRGMLSGKRAVVITAMLMLMAAGAWLGRAEPLAGGLTGVTLLAAISSGNLCVWLASGVGQYFGRISYSLYLVHTLVLQVIVSGLMHLHALARFHAIPAYAVMVAAPIGVADLFYRIVERPSHRLSIRLRPRAEVRRKVEREPVEVGA